MAGVSSSPDRRFAWDEARAQGLLGKRALVGITYLDVDGETVTGQIQLHGIIITVDRDNGIELSLGGGNEGKSFWLPAATGPFEDAQPGEYALRATGEVLVNPDIVSTWTVTKATAD